MAAPYEVSEDQYCRHCDYNLRGLTLDHDCPECGAPVLESVCLVVRVAPPKTTEQRKALEELAGKLRAAVKGSEYSADAFVFVLGAVRYAGLAKSGGEGITAREVCEGVRDYARVRLGGTHAAVEMLAEWKIRRSEDVGRIIFGMVETGRLAVSPGDSPEDFAGLFVLDDFLKDPAEPKPLRQE